MRAGIDAEAERQRLEERRTFHQYALEACSKRFQVPVASQRLGLAGRVDCLFELTEVTLEHAAGGVRPAGWEADRPLFVPVEYKTTFRTDRKENVLQLMAYAAILEDLTGTPVPFGFLVFLPEEEVVRVDLGPGLRKTLGVLVDEVRAGLGDAELPPPTPFRGRCVDCEFRRFCNDVF
jgi:CRISPR-associated exonuclease Cas4